jgi:hypothetical protein
MTHTETLRLALEALYGFIPYLPLEHDKPQCDRYDQAITAIKAALEAKDEPVAYINVEQRKLEWAKYMSWDTPTVVNLPKIPLYTTPPQRTWVGLTDEHKEGLICMTDPNPEPHHLRELIDVVEFQLKEKNCSL